MNSVRLPFSYPKRAEARRNPVGADGNGEPRSLLHIFDDWLSCESAATPVHPVQRDIRRPDLKRLPWSVTCLSPTRQSELLATQNPDGSLVFSAVLKDGQGLLSFLLVPPSAK